VNSEFLKSSWFFAIYLIILFLVAEIVNRYFEKINLKETNIGQKYLRALVASTPGFKQPLHALWLLPGFKGCICATAWKPLPSACLLLPSPITPCH